MSQSHHNADIFSQPPTDKPLFEVKEWNAVAIWGWNSTTDTCAICRESLMSACIQCQASSITTPCKLAWGECNHGFHAHCLKKWLTDDRDKCPLDNMVWKYKQIKGE